MSAPAPSPKQTNKKRNVKNYILVNIKQNRYFDKNKDCTFPAIWTNAKWNELQFTGGWLTAENGMIQYYYQLLTGK